MYETGWENGSIGMEESHLDEKPPNWISMMDVDAPIAAAGIEKRILPEHTDRFLSEVIQPDHGRGVFEIATHQGKVLSAVVQAPRWRWD